MSPRFQEDVLILAGDIANTMEAGDVRPLWIPRSRSQVAMDQDDWAQNPCFILFYIVLHRFIQYVLVLQWHKMTVCTISVGLAAPMFNPYSAGRAKFGPHRCYKRRCCCWSLASVASSFVQATERHWGMGIWTINDYRIYLKKNYYNAYTIHVRPPKKGTEAT